MTTIAWVDRQQVSKVAQHLKANPPKTTALNFYSFPGKDGGPDIIAKDMYPPLEHRQALDFFFFGCLHDYGFWYGSERGYLKPLEGYLELGGKPRKGSDLLWRLMKQQLDREPWFFLPQRLAEVSPEELSTCMTDALGTQWPDFDHRLQLTQAWGQWLVRNELTPALIVKEANRNQLPLKEFLEILRGSPFGRDAMMKKAVLLAMVLYNRPEQFLRVSEQDTWPAIVDYHLMRVNLRKGTVKVHPDVAKLLRSRAWVPPDVESAVREATKQAVELQVKESGLTHGEFDNIEWQARGYCPEKTGPDWDDAEPDCANCLFEPVCEQRIELFQPPFRTDAY